MDFKSLKAFPIIENGDKLILPASILDKLITLEIDYPFTFEVITNQGKTHCGVLEFSAEEGTCFIPLWIMNNLDINEGDSIYIRNISLQKASFIKFKPEVKFLELSDPRATLEYILRSFSCVTIGDKLHFHYNNKLYILDIVDVKPKKACCIIDADIEVEFDEPDKSDKSDNSESDKYDKSLHKLPSPQSSKPNETELNVPMVKPNVPMVKNGSENINTKWGKLSKMAHFQGPGNKMV